MALGKTCRYCSRCEIVMVHQKELEAELALGLSRMAPEATAKDYWVLGTIEQKIWQEGLGASGEPVVKMLRHVADFKEQYELVYKPGGGYPVTQQ